MYRSGVEYGKARPKENGNFVFHANMQSPVSQNEQIPSDVRGGTHRKQFSHMMPVECVVARRRRDREPPPGFPRTSPGTGVSARDSEKPPTGLWHLTDANNSSKHIKDMFKSKHGNEMPTRTDTHGIDFEGSSRNPHISPHTSRWHGQAISQQEDKRGDSEKKLKSTKGSPIWNIKEAVFKRLKQTNQVPISTLTMEIGGDTIVVNVFPETAIEARHVEPNPRQTPENYEQTIDFYEHVTLSRRSFFRCLYEVGDMLLSGQLEGDVADWKAYVMKSHAENVAWKQKCRRSQAYFEKTKKVLGQETPVYTRLFRFLRRRAGRLVMSLRLAFSCPCFGT